MVHIEHILSIHMIQHNMDVLSIYEAKVILPNVIFKCMQLYLTGHLRTSHVYIHGQTTDAASFTKQFAVRNGHVTRPS